MAFRFDFDKIPKEEHDNIEELVRNVDIKGLWTKYVIPYDLVEDVDKCCIFVEIVNHFKAKLDESRNQ